VYATPVSGVPDVVREGDTGFLMQSRAPDDIAAGIEGILAREDLGDVSHRGRSLIESEYNPDAAVERYRRILTDAVAR
jgi:glycosyltransferase involved in cell wall biosynthesis